MTKIWFGLLVVALLVTSTSPSVAKELFFKEFVRCNLNPETGNFTWGGEDDGPVDQDIARFIGPTSVPKFTSTPKGVVEFYSDDTFTFQMAHGRNGGLRPNTQFSCKMTCMGNTDDGPNGANDPVLVVDCGTTDKDGDMALTVRNFRSAHSSGSAGSLLCTGPVFEILESFPVDEPQRCKTGFGNGGGAL